MYPGQHMSVEDNIFYAKRNIVDSILKEATIEGIDITFPATKAVFEGAKIANLTQDQSPLSCRYPETCQNGRTPIQH